MNKKGTNKKDVSMFLVDLNVVVQNKNKKTRFLLRNMNTKDSNKMQKNTHIKYAKYNKQQQTTIISILYT